LWSGFVYGNGGTLLADGRFDLTNAGAVGGLVRLGDICSRYGGAGVSCNAAAMDFAPYPAYESSMYVSVPADSGLPPGWRYARFPKMAQAVIPTDLYGWRLFPSDERTLQSGTDGAAIDGLLQFCLWYYQQ